jgi:hypothetical protein
MKILKTTCVLLLAITVSGCNLEGDNGDPGLTGPPGPQGPAGIDGKDGKDGKDGVDGQDGVDGAAGINGRDGKNGIDGVNGNDGLDGIDGADGINCWDLNRDGTNDANEDENKDGIWDTNDCLARLPPVQNVNVTLNHHHLCRALANLGEYPSGCPSRVHTPPVGTQTQMSNKTFFIKPDGNYASCGLPPNNGLLSIEETSGIYYWKLEGGFMSNKRLVATLDELSANVCYESCKLDPNCVASYTEEHPNSNLSSYDCYQFHHSDTVGTWSHLCGNSANDCILSLAATQKWSVTCP